MGFIIEFICELIFEGIEAITFNKKTPKWLRMIATISIMTVFILVIGFLSCFVILLFHKNEILVALFLLGLDVFFIVGTIYRIKKYVKINSTN